MLGKQHRVASLDQIPAETFAGFPGFNLKRVADPERAGASRDFRISHSEVAVGGGTHRHVHHNSDEAWYVIFGSGEFFCDGTSTSFGAGEFLFAERGAVHQVINTGEDTLAYLAFTVPPCDFVNDNIVVEEFDWDKHVTI